jgi:hypothetical protein
MDTLIQICSKNTLHYELSVIIEKIVEAFGTSALERKTKNTFIINLFKNVLSKASLLFSFISISSLSDDPDFCSWFVEQEVKI